MVKFPEPYQVMREKIIAAMREFELATGSTIARIQLRHMEAVPPRDRVFRELLIDVNPIVGDTIE
jgi:hypothetical protein